MTLSETIKALRCRQIALEVADTKPSYDNEADVTDKAIAALERLRMYERRRLYIFPEDRKEGRKWR